ncbi:HbrB-like-domain-containing protein [Geranomyces variabilis]|nr:HbrB-like-domain-containing protein [Geranomyces variabilis]
MSRANAWQALCIKVLPLFNGQGLRGHMEDMNELVSTWLGESYSSQAINEDLNEMLTTGLLTLSTKLAAVGDEGLANRIVEVWSFFFTTVVPYLQGVFLPIRTQWRLVDADPPDVRMLTLCGFRDQILLPLSGRMVECFPRLSTDIENGRKVNDTASRLMQMLCIASGLPGPAERQKVVTSLLFDFKQTMMGSKKEAEATNRNSMALYGSRVHASS